MEKEDFAFLINFMQNGDSSFDHDVSVNVLMRAYA